MLIYQRVSIEFRLKCFGTNGTKSSLYPTIFRFWLRLQDNILPVLAPGMLHHTAMRIFCLIRMALSHQYQYPND